MLRASCGGWRNYAKCGHVLDNSDLLFCKALKYVGRGRGMRTRLRVTDCIDYFYDNAQTGVRLWSNATRNFFRVLYFYDSIDKSIS